MDVPSIDADDLPLVPNDYLSSCDNDNHSDLRIVLVGKTGVGKSATGNTILGRPGAFKAEANPNSVTAKCQKQSGEVAGRTVDVIDTPGIGEVLLKGQSESRNTGQAEKAAIAECVELSVPGPHVFLLVISLASRFTPEERNAVKWIEDNFGQEAAGYTIVLFTHGDGLGLQSVEDYMEKSEDLMGLVNRCGDRYHVFNNIEQGDTQVRELLKNIEEMVNKNGDHYTNDMYKEVQRKMNRKIIVKRTLVGLSGVGAVVAGAGLGLIAAPVEAAVVVGMVVAGGVAAIGGGISVAVESYREGKKKERERTN